eukprot:887491_1
MEPLSLPPSSVSTKKESTSSSGNQQDDRSSQYKHQEATTMDPYNYSQFLFKLQYQKLLKQQQKQKQKAQLQICEAKFNEIKRKLAPRYQARFKMNSQYENYVPVPSITDCASSVCTIPSPHIHIDNDQNVMVQVNRYHSS